MNSFTEKKEMASSFRDNMDRVYFNALTWGLLGSVSVILNRLAMMQTEGLVSFGAAFVASLFALTSVMYARARAAATPEETAIRAEIADDCLRLIVIAVTGFLITAFTFFILSENHRPRAGHILDPNTEPEAEPAIAAVTCIFLFAIPVVVKMNVILERVRDNMGLGKQKELA